MIDRTTAKRALSRLFGRQPIADLASLQRVLATSSRTTVFRILSDLGYWTSYSHAGRYYTLEDRPQFDEYGLWAHGDILFSRHHTLRATIVHFVDEAPAGQTHAELQGKLRLRVHDTLRDLVKDKRIGRRELESLYLYVSARRSKAPRQVSERLRLLEEYPKQVALPSKSATIEILLAFIRHPREDPITLTSLLQGEGKRVSHADIEAVFATHGLGKKKLHRGPRGAERRSPPPRG